MGFEIVAVTGSPIKGGDGNREFLFHAVKKGNAIPGRITDSQISDLVKERK